MADREITWKEFKEQVEAQNVTDEMFVDHIDWDAGHEPDVHTSHDKKSFYVWQGEA